MSGPQKQQQPEHTPEQVALSDTVSEFVTNLGHMTIGDLYVPATRTATGEALGAHYDDHDWFLGHSGLGWHEFFGSRTWNRKNIIAMFLGWAVVTLDDPENVAISDIQGGTDASWQEARPVVFYRLLINGEVVYVLEDEISWTKLATPMPSHS